MENTARFHLPGLRYNFPLNMMTLDMMKKFPEYFREGVEIASFFGEFPTSLWGGGRFCYDDQCDGNFIRSVVKTINSHGIPIRYTFTNPSLTERDMSDPYCNFCMRVADNDKNQVLVVSPLLEDYIRKRYPGFKINSSTCKEIRDIDALNEELSKDYYLVVLDYNLNNNFELLEKINRKDKCELLVNSCCIPNCPRRGMHYSTIGRENRITLLNRKNPPDKQMPVPGWSCEYGEKNNIYTIQKYSTFISPEAIWEKYIPMGFHEFKIEGRTANLFQLIDTYCLYLMKPERRDEGRLELISNLQSSKVITVGRPRKAMWNG